MVYARWLNADTAMDITQEAFLRLWKQWQGGEDIINPRAWLLRVALFQNLNLTADAEDVRHLLFEFEIAALQVVAYLVRLSGMYVENFAYSPLHQFREAFLPGSRPIFARMASQEPRRPAHADTQSPSLSGRPATRAMLWPRL